MAIYQFNNIKRPYDLFNQLGSQFPVIQKQTDKTINILFWLLVIGLGAYVAKDIIFAPFDLSTGTRSTVAGHEWQYNLWRIMAMADSLKDGSSGRWIHSFNFGWGYPLFYYTAPLPYWIGGSFVLMGFDPNAALNWCWILAIVGSGASMYWATNPILGRACALLAATCYLLAPYHLVDIFVRTSLVESWAFVFLPLILRGIWFLESRPFHGMFCIAVGLITLSLTHLITTFLSGLTFAIFFLVYVFSNKNIEKLKFITHATIAVILGLMLTAFFWLPAIIDIEHTRGPRVISGGYYHFSKHFVYWHQLISDSWAYGSSVIGPKDYMSFSLSALIVISGLLTFGLALFALVFRLRHFIPVCGLREKQIPTSNDLKLLIFTIATFCAAFFATFMTTESSSIIWNKFTLLELVQFPWRFLLGASFFSALVVATLPHCLSLILKLKQPTFTAVIALILSLLVIQTNSKFAQVGGYGEMSNSELSEKHIRDTGVWTTSALEFLPSDSATPWKESKPAVPTEFIVRGVPRPERILSTELKHGRIEVKFTSGPSGFLKINQQYHPAWAAIRDGKSVPVQKHENNLNPMKIRVPSNARQVVLTFHTTTAGKIGFFISLLTSIALVVLTVIFRKKIAHVNAHFYLLLTLIAILIYFGQTFSSRGKTTQQFIEETAKTYPLARLNNPVKNGASWNNSSHIVLDELGIKVIFKELQVKKQLRISVDSNDVYWLGFLNRGKLIGTVNTGQSNSGGMTTYTLTTPREIQGRQFDSLVIKPITGDGSYSVGHLSFLN